MIGQQFKRQLVTIMSVDVVSYSRLMGENEDNTLVQLNKHRKTVEQSVTGFGGRMFGVAGDSQMAEFSSAVDAVRSAVEFQLAIANGNEQVPDDYRMSLRVGLNIGDVIIENGDLFGDDVNIAARLQEGAHPGGVAISQTVFSHIGGKTELLFKDAGFQKFKNINIPARLYHVQVGDEVDEQDDALPGVPSAPAPLSVVPGLADRPALAVLPFSDQGSSNDSQYIAEGLSEDLSIGLAKMRWFPVISKNSSFVFRGKPVDEKTIGLVLGARYLLEGSVRLRGDQLRVTAQLVNAEEGVNIWTNTYHYLLDDIFDLQDEIAQNIISALSTQIDQAEQSRSYAKPYENLDTWDLVKRGSWHQSKLTKQDATAAYDLFSQALERDPNSVEALVQMAWWNFWHVWTQNADAKKLVEMERLARWAMHMDRMDARPHMLIGISMLMRRKADQSRISLKEAIRLNPSLALAHASIGTAYILAGNGEKAISPLKTAMRLNPVDLNCFHTLGELAIAHMMIGKTEECLAYSEQSLGLRPGYWYSRLSRITAMVESGQVENARQEVIELENHNPNFNLRRIRWLPFVDAKWNNRLVEGLSRAGFTNDGSQ
jgi:adenylate cyclase